LKKRLKRLNARRAAKTVDWNSLFTDIFEAHGLLPNQIAELTMDQFFLLMKRN